MRASLAIIVDSFREALASRVLWILLVLATLVLAALAPLALRQELYVGLDPRAVLNPRGLVEPIVKEFDTQTATAKLTPARHLASLLNDQRKEQFRQALDPEKTGGRPARVTPIAETFESLMEEENFFNEDAWKGIPLRAEGETLRKAKLGELSNKEVQRLNRLALEAAFPGMISRSPSSALYLSYMGWDIGGQLPIPQTQIKTVVSLVISGLMSFLVGTIGIFVAILVTANVVPVTYEAGAIDLLLSKPVYRGVVFITKFLGACAFIAVLTTYFIVGLYLLVGIRFDLWNHELLLTIPVFLFIFSIYYSVSAVSGLIWRNAIVSVVMTGLFFILCFSIGTTRNVIETVFLKPRRIQHVEPTPTGLYVQFGNGAMARWDSEEEKWLPIFVSDKETSVNASFPPVRLDNSRVVGPWWDERDQRLLSVTVGDSGPFGGFAAAGPPLQYTNKEFDWRTQRGIELPARTRAVFPTAAGSLLAITPQSIWEMTGKADVKATTTKLFGVEMPTTVASGGFKQIGTGWTRMGERPFVAAYSPQADTVATLQKGSLSVLRRQQGTFVETATRDLEIDERPALVAIAGALVLVGLENGEILLLNGSDLSEANRLRPFGTLAPRKIIISPTEKWAAILSHGDDLALIDLTTNQLSNRWSTLGRVHHLRFADEKTIFVVDRIRRIRECDADTLEVKQVWKSEVDTLETVYDWIINPLYTLFPKPSELDNLVQYILTKQETAPLNGPGEVDLGEGRLKMNIWEPVQSSTAFVIVMLALGWIYVARKDF